uniref:F-box protein SKIP23-like n=1 Tax=Elaeis guineensis var. tenera TaxID=51953 RepID=A0A6J0PHS2_ELAGV|nr:F-box protein SKIP23-like [Elaeis guineensis]
MDRAISLSDLCRLMDRCAWGALRSVLGAIQRITSRKKIKHSRQWSKFRPHFFCFQSLCYPRTTKMAADWSQLPAELLEIISTKIIFITDYLRFRAVCTSWRSASPARPRHLPPQLPWLLLPYDPSPDNADARRLFFDLRDRRIHQLDLPETRGKGVCGSSHGWLVLERHLAISLLNPVTRAYIQLPPLNTSPKFLYFPPSGVPRLFPALDAGQMFEKRCIKNVTLSSDPALNSDCIVMAVLQWDGILAFCRIRDESWTIISGAHFFSDKSIDVAYHDGRFYSVTAHGQVTVYDVNSPQRIVLPSRLQYSWDQKYLVDQSSQELLMVEWNFKSRSANGGSNMMCSSWM